MWFPEAFAVPSNDTATIAELLVNKIMERHGAPRTLLSDRGSKFLSSLLKEVCYLMDTKKVFITSYHPQCDGLVERFHGNLTGFPCTYCKQWPERLGEILEPSPFCLPCFTIWHYRWIIFLHAVWERTTPTYGCFPTSTVGNFSVHSRALCMSCRTYWDCSQNCQGEYSTCTATHERLSWQDGSAAQIQPWW